MRKTFFALLMLSAAPVLFAQGVPFTGTGTVSLTANTPANVGGQSFTVDVNVNLTGVSGTCGVSTAGVLGGYEIPISFDPAQVQFVSAAACTSPQFAAAPTATAAGTANSSGVVTVAASQTNQTAPTGQICVARLTFQSVGSDPTTLTPSGDATLSSAFQNCAGEGTAGPAAIPFTTTALNLLAATAVPLFSTTGMALLAGALAIVALFSKAIR
jgi:hypothetical protein